MSNSEASKRHTEAISAFMSGALLDPPQATAPTPQEDAVVIEPYSYTNTQSDQLTVRPDHRRPGVVVLVAEQTGVDPDVSETTFVSMGSEEAAELAQYLLDAAGDGGRVVKD